MMDNREKNFISAIVYVHNNEPELANFILEINTVLNNNFKNYELIFVNETL